MKNRITVEYEVCITVILRCGLSQSMTQVDFFPQLPMKLLATTGTSNCTARLSSNSCPGENTQGGAGNDREQTTRPFATAAQHSVPTQEVLKGLVLKILF